MGVELSKDMIALSEAGIPLDDFSRVMDLAAAYNFEQTENAVQDFEDAIKLLNEKEALPSWLSDWCIFYHIQHDDMDGIEPIEPEFDM